MTQIMYLDLVHTEHILRVCEIYVNEKKEIKEKNKGNEVNDKIRGRILQKMPKITNILSDADVSC